MHFTSEQAFEDAVIEYLSSRASAGGGGYHQRYWEYLPEINTTDGLWENFKGILEQLNPNPLRGKPLSDGEFDQVKRVISSLRTPYEAGRFLYGMNGVSQIEIDLDDGRHVYLDVFDQRQVGAGSTRYQVVHQIQRPPKQSGKQSRRFDVTLLINGLPVIQIELKNHGHNVQEALNQMHQYIDEGQYGDIFSTVQILVGMTPSAIRYMANTTTELFNRDFAFQWQLDDENNTVVRDWRLFCDRVLSIPMAHQLSTSYMILDSTANSQMLKIMRPYQVYATQHVLEKLKSIDFDFGINKLGYIWHTTGSGKTITSFKTAWLANRMPQIDKVVFVVDRIALTQQTSDSYRAYDPDGTPDSARDLGAIRDTRNTRELWRQLRTTDSHIIITSVQKLARLVEREDLSNYKKNVLFIVDEAHRSTAGESFSEIQAAFRRSAWVGYTGTPMFDDTTKGLTTEDIFGEMLHAYTIRGAIADGNVLGFKVDFENTIDQEKGKQEFYPDYFRQLYPDWSEEQIQERVANLTPEDMDDMITPSMYDNRQEHVEMVVKNIFDNWQNRSVEGKYNALFTTHVGGGLPSTPMALMYFREFQKQNKEREKEGKFTLKVAVTFSKSSGHTDYQREVNKGLHDAMKVFNKTFGTNHDMTDVGAYTQDVTSRLDRTAQDKRYLDLVIVVDQLLTGFDAPQMNTLYVDRIFKNAALIQAYSRTNRVFDMQDKPWGRIVNFRWPAHNERLMNEALAIYSNKHSANLSDEERQLQNEADGILARSFDEEFHEVKGAIERIRDQTYNLNRIPHDEDGQERLYQDMRTYSRGMARLKQYSPEEGENGEVTGFDYDQPDALIRGLGMTPEEEELISHSLYNELREALADRQQIPVAQIDFKMSHVKDVIINYDYLTDLIVDLLNQVHEGRDEEASDTQAKIVEFSYTVEDPWEGQKIRNSSESMLSGETIAEEYPVTRETLEQQRMVDEGNNNRINGQLTDFRYKWGITDIIKSDELREFLMNHRYGKRDLERTDQLENIRLAARKEYKYMARDPEVQALHWVHYRKQFTDAIYEKADELVRYRQ